MQNDNFCYCLEHKTVISLHFPSIKQNGRCDRYIKTEIYLIGVSGDDITFFQDVMKEYTEEDFSIAIDK